MGYTDRQLVHDRDMIHILGISSWLSRSHVAPLPVKLIWKVLIHANALHIDILPSATARY